MDAHRIYDLTVVHLFKCILNLGSRAVNMPLLPPYSSVRFGGHLFTRAPWTRGPFLRLCSQRLLLSWIFSLKFQYSF